VDGFNTYYVSRAARRAGVTVALSGLGGDELFGGYASFRDVPRATRWLRLARPRALVGPVLRWLARRLRSRGLLKLAAALGRPTGPEQLYLLRRELFLPAERRALLPLPAGSDPYTGLTAETLDGLAAWCRGPDAENTVSALELTGYMRHMLLRDSDVFSMAHGLELRVPLLDHELVGTAAILPGAWKRPGPVPKPLLIEAVGPRLPRRVQELPKRGFTFPWADWFRTDLAAAARDRLNDRGTWADLGFDPAAPGKLWDRFRRKDPAVGGLHVLALVVLADLAARQQLRVA
jgi:asparagine synthase (glutamine-hydrolysing)